MATGTINNIIATINSTDVGKLQIKTKEMTINDKTATSGTWDSAFTNNCLLAFAVCNHANFYVQSTVVCNSYSKTGFEVWQSNSANAAMVVRVIGIGY